MEKAMVIVRVDYKRAKKIDFTSVWPSLGWVCAGSACICAINSLLIFKPDFLLKQHSGSNSQIIFLTNTNDILIEFRTTNSCSKVWNHNRCVLAACKIT